jgi:DNA-binding NtrC family response regulator
VVLLDLRLPDCSGIEALRRIRRVARTVPVIMMTAYASTETVVQATCGCVSGSSSTRPPTFSTCRRP